YTMHTYVYHPEQRYNYDDRVPIPGMSGKDPGEPWTPEYTHRPGEQYADTFFPDGEVQPWNYWRGNYGDDFISRPKFFIELDRWYCYELMIKTNTPGKKDGRITGWVDGEVILDFPNMRFRDIADLKIDLIGFSFGSASTPAATSSWFDNIVIAKSYIGPVYDGSPVDPIPAEKDGVKVKLMAFDARSDRNNPVFKSAPVTITGNGTYTATVNTVGYQDFAGLALMTTDTKFEYYCNTDFSGATKAPPDWQDSTLTFDEIKINGVAVGNNRGTTPLVTEGHISAKLWDGWSASHRRLTGVNIIDTGTNHSSVCFAVEGVPLINRIEVTFTVGGLPEPLPTFVLDVVDFEGREVITICNTTPAARSVKCYYIYYLDDEDTVKHQLLSYIIESGDFIVIRGDDITPVLKRAKVNFDISSVDLLWLYDAYGEEISRWERV
ncbi:MAG: hypothetical protein FWG33_03130, partial [Oscillospiraceae bacterium]|nr:hypothetical protein [Oscillospiraceae bacterium]